MLVNNTGDYSRVFGDTIIVPGVNNLTKEQVDLVKAKAAGNPALQVVMNQLEFEELDEGLTDMTVDKLKGLVAETTGIDVLEQMRADEAGGKNRSGAIAAIDERISELKGGDDSEG